MNTSIKKRIAVLALEEAVVVMQVVVSDNTEVIIRFIMSR